ncbi:uncharacterized protein LOC120282957 [Dioscorea cayenensis subsp. rotundata]|uniref:Uncharacterized protein LOC120282957 n=1 Tax=Dioscorea cayennensis subsp. rotundata TaxID=55577 RepID=A0AB40D023_DIOCR|nr:uncharacterized protein LOC120282957 [Dioscorea cayenensis subsp. rotundata]
MAGEDLPPPSSHPAYPVKKSGTFEISADSLKADFSNPYFTYHSDNPEIADSVIYYPTAHEVWEDLRERFSQRNAPRIFEIQRDIASLRQEQLSISAYYTKLKSLWDELATYSDASYGTQADQQKLMQFLMGLNETYNAIRGQILLMNPLPSIRQAYSLVTQEEKQRILSSVISLGDSSTSTAAMAAIHSKTTPSTTIRTEQQLQSFNGSPPQAREFIGRQDKDRRHGSGRGRPICKYCGDLGHWAQKCFKLHGYPPGHPKSKKNFSQNSNRDIHSANHVSEASSRKMKDLATRRTIGLGKQCDGLYYLMALESRISPHPQTDRSPQSHHLTHRPGIIGLAMSHHLV